MPIGMPTTIERGSTVPQYWGDVRDPRQAGYWEQRNRSAQEHAALGARVGLARDEMDLKREMFEKSDELAWARFNWQKQWDPEKFYAGQDLSREMFGQEMGLKRDYYDMQRDQNQFAMDFFNQYSPYGRGGGRGMNPYQVDTGPVTVYGEGYFDEGGEGYDYGDYDYDSYGGIDYYNLSELNDSTWDEFMGG